MADCSACASNGKCTRDKTNCMIENNSLNNVNKIIGVMSGKGGVGKSSISAIIAKKLKSLGYRVGILDADITGPSIPRLLGVENSKVTSQNNMMIPVQSSEGIKVMSLNLLIDNEEDPVLWRGPIISATVKQFWTDVLWGELDYLIIDMPPGTGDVALTVMQSVPINGVVMVSVPQDLVSMIVSKAVNMAKKMNINILGVIENMSYITCSKCGEKIKLFNGENTEKFLNNMKLKLLGELPMISSINNLGQYKDFSIDESLDLLFEPIINNVIDELKQYIKLNNIQSQIIYQVSRKTNIIFQFIIFCIIILFNIIQILIIQISQERLFMKKVQGNMKSCLQPAPKVLVSCRDANGKDNALAVGYCGNCSYDPPMVMVGIVPSRYSYNMIKETGVFVVNLTTKEQKEMFDYLGSHSGRNEDKLAKYNVEEAIKINAPLLSDCPVNIECKVVDSIMTGSHEMFIGKIEYVHVNDDLVDENGNINFPEINLLQKVIDICSKYIIIMIKGIYPKQYIKEMCSYAKKRWNRTRWQWSWNRKKTWTMLCRSNFRKKRLRKKRQQRIQRFQKQLSMEQIQYFKYH
eukprot:TRINITY_DN10476_c0_g1_i1.p1 TRINITY_DN10476_c0_g1~~TRINITY_DN10476_c0_g1_i1.p1  ORF type:complete len:577 (-),score=58.25 TRINITY_DN10476_c0_g1_i1:1119-2849(-)